MSGRRGKIEILHVFRLGFSKFELRENPQKFIEKISCWYLINYSNVRGSGTRLWLEDCLRRKFSSRARNVNSLFSGNFGFELRQNLFEISLKRHQGLSTWIRRLFVTFVINLLHYPTHLSESYKQNIVSLLIFEKNHKQISGQFLRVWFMHFPAL